MNAHDPVLGDRPRRPLVFGHRGAAAHVLENTLDSIETAIRAGADGVEIDIRLTRDGVVVLLHDATLDRTGQGKGAIGNTSYADAHAGKVPSLRETLDCIAGRCALNVEIKDPEAWPAARAILQEDARRETRTDAWMSSFDIALMERVAAEGFPVGLLYSQRRGAVTAASLQRDVNRIRPRALHLPRDLVTRELIVRMTVPVYVWTVNDPLDARRIRDLGAAALYSDDPGLIIAALDEDAVRMPVPVIDAPGSRE